MTRADPDDWRDVPGFDGRYQVTPDGRVRSTYGRKAELRPFPKRPGSPDLYANVYRNGEAIRMSVADLVRLAHGTDVRQDHAKPNGHARKSSRSLSDAISNHKSAS